MSVTKDKDGKPTGVSERRRRSYPARLYVDVLKKYADFDGRARRREFWLFNLGNLFVLLCIAGAVNGLDAIAVVYFLVVLVPSIAVGVRRMHDTDHSGWWLFCPVVNLSLACTKGTRGRNRYGRDPGRRRILLWGLINQAIR